MISLSEARDLVIKELQRISLAIQDDELIILDDKTIDEEFGWVFFYTSKKFFETGNPFYLPLGNAPIIVDKKHGKLFVTGTDKPIEEFIREFKSR